MHAQTLPARAGLAWLRAGLALFRRQPMGFTGLVIAYLFVLLLLSNLPFLGVALAAIIVPFGTVALAAAGRDAERDIAPRPQLLLEGWRMVEARGTLLRLGMLHAGLMLTVNVVIALLAADQVEQWKVVDGQLDAASVMANLPWDAVGLGVALYVPTLMLTWFSPLLVAWQKMPLGKSVFFSFFACWRNRGAFLVVSALLFGLIVVCALVAAQIVTLAGLRGAYASLVMTPVALVMSAIAYSTLWPMWRSIFLAPSGETEA
ncbi:MAG: BPSS1780 family membrane protein [Burkholderiaceae bacterium]